MTGLTALTWLTPLPGDMANAVAARQGGQSGPTVPRKLAALEALKQALLHRAFAGEL